MNLNINRQPYLHHKLYRHLQVGCLKKIRLESELLKKYHLFWVYFILGNSSFTQDLMSSVSLYEITLLLTVSFNINPLPHVVILSSFHTELTHAAFLLQ